jgi:hypothetical protein
LRKYAERSLVFCSIQINITPNNTGQISTNVSGGGQIFSRTTPIIHAADE